MHCIFLTMLNGYDPACHGVEGQLHEHRNIRVPYLLHYIHIV